MTCSGCTSIVPDAVALIIGIGGTRSTETSTGTG